MKIKLSGLLLILFVLIACKEPFKPEIELSGKRLLVVEGYINIGGITTIKLSRTQDLQTKAAVLPEANAQIVVEGPDGFKVQGTTNSSGVCQLATQSLSIAKKYRLQIVGANKKVYKTQFLEPVPTPPIDSINFKIENEGFQIYANTHATINDTRYYMWDFDETWEVRSAYPSYYEFKDYSINERDPNINISRCWVNASSTQILLGSTERLSENRLTLAPLTYIKGNAVRVSEQYSILVRQYGVNKQAYQYFENMKKNTEKIGTIFDPQPSELKGNIICESDPSEEVIGWISAGTITQKRFFISKADKPAGRAWKYDQGCDRFWSTPDSVRVWSSAGYLIISQESDAQGRTGFSMSFATCVDCRTRGSNIKPSYWPN